MLLLFSLGLLLNSVWSHESTDIQDIDIYYPSEIWSDTFDWKLLKVLSQQSENVLVSPISLKLVLAVLYEGSSGATEREFESGLKFAKKKLLREKFRDTLDTLQVDPSSNNILNISTRLFLDSEIQLKSSFALKAKNYYDTDIEVTNFTDATRASQNINSWIEQATLGKIAELVNPGDLKDTIMLISNAVYFKGTWIHQFPKNQTSVGPFYTNPEHTIYIPFMTSTNMFYYYESRFLDAKILRLPYKGNNYSMFIVLPLSKGGLPELIQKINLFDLHRQLYYMDKKLVQVAIPKFKFNFKASYAKLLRQFGLYNMFQGTASFPGIAVGNSTILRKLVVSDVMQTTGIEVDEEGSIVYSATDVIIGNKIGVPDYDFNATHPFLFFIGEETNGTVLFIGKIENPLQRDAAIQATNVVDNFEEFFAAPENITKSNI